jgi:hypothetical protein
MNLVMWPAAAFAAGPFRHSPIELATIDGLGPSILANGLDDSFRPWDVREPTIELATLSGFGRCAAGPLL